MVPEGRTVLENIFLNDNEMRPEEKIFLTDDEMFITAVHLAERAYHTSKITTLSPEQKVKLAKDLHFKYKASKQQLRRILRLENTVLDELFPI